jgi:outer membrane receptor for ferrienterochelin and colicin
MNTKTIKIIFIIFCILIIHFDNQIFAQQKPIDEYTKEEIKLLTYDQLLDLSFEDLTTLAEKMGISVDELLNMQITVSSKTELTPRESPGIVSVITNEEIQNSGARDLIDILRFVPGFSINYDGDGVIGPGIRGNWGQEGKILILLDGQQMNDGLFLSNCLGNHFDVNQIQRIEISRGPGSSIYGGSAELSVINIITKSGQEINGIKAVGTISEMKETFGRRNITFISGKKIKDFEFSLTGFYGENYRTNNPYYSFYGVGDSAALSDSYTKNINLKLKYKNLSYSFILDNYSNLAIYDENYYEEYNGFMSELKYDIKLNDKMTVTPKISIKHNKPWYIKGEPKYERVAQIYDFNLNFSYKINKNVDLIAGGNYDYYLGFYENKSSDTTITFYNGAESLFFHNISGYVQTIISSKIVNFTFGGRFEYHNLYGSSFAPRAGITKVIDNFHFKLLYSRAFHSPSVGNIIYNQEIKPEIADITELELGYRINQNLFFTSNLFDIRMDKIIIYFDDGDFWGYKNGKKINSKGFEFEFRTKYAKWYSILNYSYYKLNTTDTICRDYYLPPSNQNVSLGMPQHKATAQFSYNITNKIALSPSFVYLSKCYAYTTLDEFEEPEESIIEQAFLINLFLNFNNLVKKRLNLGIGVYDILDINYNYVQAYNGYSPPFSGPGREILVKLSLNFNFDE